MPDKKPRHPSKVLWDKANPRPAPVPIRFSAEELEYIDKQRGEESRSAFIRRLVLGSWKK